MPDLTPIEDQFADALDALVLGMPNRGGDPDLAATAAAIQQLGSAATNGSDGMPADRLDRATKTRIWADLMREQGASTATPPLAPVSGGTGSTLSLNPWTPKPEAKPRRARSSSTVLRFVPDAQPLSTFLLIVAVVVLVGATFATLSPDNRRGFLPSASATENAPALAATPEATPEVTTGTCDLAGGGIYSWAPETPYEYEPTGVVAPRTYDALGPFFATFSACMAPDVSRVGQFASARFMTEFRDSLEGTPTAGVEDRIAAMAEYWTFSLSSQQGVQSFTWEGSGMGEPQRLHLFPDTARVMADGRLGVLISITPAGVSPVPDQSWIDQETPGTYAVFLVALGGGMSVDPPLSIDELIGHCGGGDCVAMYGADAEPQAPPPATNGSIPTHIRIEGAEIDTPVNLLDAFTGPVPLPEGIWTAGWFGNTAAAGEFGNMVIFGYVDDGRGGGGAFWSLERVLVGSVIDVTSEDGGVYTYKVDSVSPLLSFDDPTLEEGVSLGPIVSDDATISIVAFGGALDAATGDPESAIIVRGSLVATPAATPNASPAAASACATTLVHTEVWPDAPPGSALQSLPWVEAETVGAVITGHQFYGDRPLPVNGLFLDDGAVAKVLWTFDRSVQNLTITATNLNDPGTDPVTIPAVPANSNDGSSTEWPSNISLPSPGCWQLSLTAEDKAGTGVTGTVTYEVPEILAPEPTATPVVSTDSNPDDICVPQPQFLTDDQVREMSMDDWRPPLYQNPFRTEPDQEQAIRDTWVRYMQCLMVPFLANDRSDEFPPELYTYLSDRARFVLMEDELSTDQQAGIAAFNCIDRVNPLLDNLPLPVNVIFNMTVPTTNPPPPDWVNPYDDVPVYRLGDGRYGMMLGTVSSTTLRDLDHPEEGDWLTFVAFVEVNGTFYVDEQVSLITPSSQEHGTPMVLEDACA